MNTRQRAFAEATLEARVQDQFVLDYILERIAKKFGGGS